MLSGVLICEGVGMGGGRVGGGAGEASGASCEAY